MMFNALKAKVANRGAAPDSFLKELIEWGHAAPAELFAPRPAPPDRPDPDVYAYLKPILGPWETLLHRRAVMLELMRVHAGFESSWNWKCGVDTTNHHSLTHIEGEETGIFQVSFDSTFLEHHAMKPFAVEHGIATAGSFIPAMKTNHKLALEYYARLVRISIKWAGPLLRHEVDRYLSRAAVKEFQTLLS